MTICYRQQALESEGVSPRTPDSPWNLFGLTLNADLPFSAVLLIPRRHVAFFCAFDYFLPKVHYTTIAAHPAGKDQHNVRCASYGNYLLFHEELRRCNPDRNQPRQQDAPKRQRGLGPRPEGGRGRGQDRRVPRQHEGDIRFESLRAEGKTPLRSMRRGQAVGHILDRRSTSWLGVVVRVERWLETPETGPSRLFEVMHHLRAVSEFTPFRRAP